MKKNFIFDQVNGFINGRAKVKIGKYWGEINTKGEWLTRIKYEKDVTPNNKLEISDTIIDKYDHIELAPHYEDGYYIACSEKKWGLLGANGETILPFEYDYDIRILNNLAITIKSGKYGAVNLKNEIIIPFEYKRLSFLSKSTICAINADNEKQIILDYTGKRIDNNEFDYICLTMEPDLWCSARINDKWVVIDETCSIVLNTEFEDIEWWNEEYGSVKNASEKWGLINKKGDLVIPCEYDWQFFHIHEDIICARKNGKYGLIDWNNNIIVDFIYEDLLPFDEGFAPALLSEKWGFIDKQGKVLKIQALANSGT